MKKFLLVLTLVASMFAFSTQALALDGEVYSGAYFDADAIELGVDTEYLVGATLSQDMNLLGVSFAPYTNLEVGYAASEWDDYKASLGVVVNVTDSLYVDGSYERYDSFDNDTDHADRYFVKVGYKFSIN